MDAKFLVERSRLSGKALFIGLLLALSAGSLLLDSTFGQVMSLQACITLPMWIATLVSAAIGLWAVPALRNLKAGQIIREDGPQAHLKKAGTPTMGGIFFIPTAVAIALIWSGLSPDVIAVSVLTLGYASIGWLDDWQILRRKSNKGISPKAKLALQITLGLAFCLWVLWSQPATISELILPLGWTLPLGFLFLPIACFTLVAESNATNLTDGVDGLAAGTGAIALLGLSALVAPTSPDLMIFSASLAGGCLGFLSHNRNPASVFMGDTGSLALGGALAAIAILSHHLFGLLILSGIFLAETLSVIAQVGYYKATKNEQGIGKRLLKMAPLHHHLELTGWPETLIVGRFYLMGGFLMLLALLLFV